MNPTSSSLAFVFPGQGSQTPGLLADLADAHPQISETFAAASAAIGVDLWSIAQAGDDDRLNQTEFTQPVLLAAGIAVWRVWQALGGPSPSRLAGHSLGEYTALVAAGVLTLDDGVRLVRERGRLMQMAVPAGMGAMAAVIGAEDAVVIEACTAASSDGIVVPANYNSPGQIVIGGNAEAVARAIEQLAERGVRKVVNLPVSVPSHTPLMRHAAEQLDEVMAGIPWHEPAIPVVQNVDASIHGNLEGIRDALVRQLYQPVRWTQCVQHLASSGVNRLGECGPGKVLTGLARRIDRTIDARALGSFAELGAARSEWSE